MKLIKIISFYIFLCAAFRVSYANEISYKTVIVENIYPIIITTLAKPIQLPSSEEMKGRFQQCVSEFAEEVVLAYFDAMRSADVARSNLCWAPDSLRQLQGRDRQNGVNEEYWRQRWLRTYAANSLDLKVTRRVEYGSFTIIQVQIKDAQGKTMKDDFPLERIGASWKLTQRLAADPVLQYWDSDKTRVQVAPQSWEPKAK